MKILANDGISKSGKEALENGGFEVITTTVAQELTAAENNTNQQSSTTDEETADSQPVLHEVPVDIRLIDEKGQFIGLGAVSLNGRLQPKKLIQL